jgi:cytochrome c-type biogenesis protein
MDPEYFRQAPFLLASLAAVAAGLLSFLSPCVLPLVPSILGYITGTAVRPEVAVRRGHAFLHALAFVLGFSLVFVLLLSQLEWVLGPLYARAEWLAGWPGEVLAWPHPSPPTYLQLAQKAAGLFLILFGLHFMGLLHLRLLEFSRQPSIRISPRLGYLSSLLVGLTFALGWTPCVTAPLAGILALGSGAYGQEMPGRMLWLLSLYSLGLGAPFLLLALLLERAGAFTRWLGRYRRPISIVSGLLLLGIGVVVFFDQLTLLSRLS